MVKCVVGGCRQVQQSADGEFCVADDARRRRHEQEQRQHGDRRCRNDTVRCGRRRDSCRCVGAQETTKNPPRTVSNHTKLCRYNWHSAGSVAPLPPLWVDVHKLCNMCVLQVNYWSVSKTAETNASRPRSRPQNFGFDTKTAVSRTTRLHITINKSSVLSVLSIAHS